MSLVDFAKDIADEVPSNPNMNMPQWLDNVTRVLEALDKRLEGILEQAKEDLKESDKPSGIGLDVASSETSDDDLDEVLIGEQFKEAKEAVYAAPSEISEEFEPAIGPECAKALEEWGDDSDE